MLLVYIESKVKESVWTFWLAFTGQKKSSIVLYSYVGVSFILSLLMLDCAVSNKLVSHPGCFVPSLSATDSHAFNECFVSINLSLLPLV